MPNVIGIFEDATQARLAIERMTKNRIGNDQIGMIAVDSEQGELEKKAAGQGPGSGIAARAGGLRSNLAALGVPAEEVTTYENQVRAGNVLVTVRAANDLEADHVANLMEVQGAVEVEGTGERGNVEAAPEYEGARVEEGNLLKSPMSSAPGRKIAPDPSGASSLRSPGGRIRIFAAIEPQA